MTEEQYAAYKAKENIRRKALYNKWKVEQPERYKAYLKALVDKRAARKGI